MPKTNLEEKQTEICNTNEGYILQGVSDDQPSVLKSVAKSIIVETIKDFFSSVVGFLLRYIRHFLRCLLYFFSPSLHKKPFASLDFKENSQHAFEFVIIVLASLIFMIKLDWIPATSKDLVEIYNNDLLQKFFEVLIFFFFAGYFLLFAGVTLLGGRLLRLIFKINLGRRESDILHVYLNNAFFSMGAVVGLILRCSASMETHDEDSIYNVLTMILLPTVIIPLFIWSVRFAMLHKMKLLKGGLFVLTTFVLYSIYFFLTSLVISMTIIGV